MNFTETGRDEQASTTAIALAQTKTTVERLPDPDLNKALHSLKTVLSKENKSMAKSYVAIASEIELIRKHEHLSKSKLKTFLVSECGVNRSDLNMYTKFKDILDTHKKTILKRGVPLTVAKALIAAPASVRMEALERIEAGSFIHSRDISTIKRRQREQAADPAVELERQRLKALRLSAQRKAQVELDTFTKRFIFFAQSLIDFFNDAQDDNVDLEKTRSPPSSTSGGSWTVPAGI
ncbi:MAG: hypothetical protein KKD02_05920 [Alphaproteobacteria bacterium]|nr:hypothetical protein [Alphaproteobacteria bacterium]